VQNLRDANPAEKHLHGSSGRFSGFVEIYRLAHSLPVNQNAVVCLEVLFTGNRLKNSNHTST